MPLFSLMPGPENKTSDFLRLSLVIRLSFVLTDNSCLVPHSLVMLGGCLGNRSYDGLSVSLQLYLFSQPPREGKEAEAELMVVLRANSGKALQPLKETSSEKFLDCQQPVPGGSRRQRGREAHGHSLMVDFLANKYTLVLPRVS